MEMPPATMLPPRARAARALPLLGLALGLGLGAGEAAAARAHAPAPTPVPASPASPAVAPGPAALPEPPAPAEPLDLRDPFAPGGAAAPARADAGVPVVSFTETDYAGHISRRLVLALTPAPAETCLGGDWKRAVATAGDAATLRDPAYHLFGGRLEVLLVNDACDRYDAYLGRFNGPVFEGQHVYQGKAGSQVVGRVRGHLGR